MTKTEAILAYIEANPNATAPEVAKALGMTVSGVRGMASRHGWSISTPKEEPTRADDEMVLHAMKAHANGIGWNPIGKRFGMCGKAVKRRVDAVQAEIDAGNC